MSKPVADKLISMGPETVALAVCHAVLEPLDNVTQLRILGTLHTRFAEPALTNLHELQGKIDKQIGDGDSLLKQLKAHLKAAETEGK